MKNNKNFTPYWPSPSNLTLSPEGKCTCNFQKDCPLEIRFHSFSFDHMLTPSYHDFFEIIYIFDGEGTFHVEDKKYEAAEGDIFIIGNAEFHRMEAHHVSLLKSIDIYFLPDFVYTAGQNNFDLEYLRPFFDHSTEFINKIPAKDFNSKTVLDLIEKIHQEKIHQREFYQLAVRNYLMEILVIIVRYYRKFSSDLFKYSKRHRDIERLQKIFTYLQEHYSEKISLDFIAEMACMSTYYLCKFFKKVTGSTLTDYIFRLRIDKAKELLLRGDLNITEVAYETGFGSHSYFDRVFRRFTKLSPQDYRYRVTFKG